MPAEQRNLQWAHYVDDNGAARAIMGELDWVTSASSGCTNIAGGEVVFGPQTKTHHVRHVIYRDPTTFRTVRYPVCTAAAFAALPTTALVWVPGLATQVSYNLAAKIPEKQRIPQAASRNLIDHP